jgi:hypothetical protein
MLSDYIKMNEMDELKIEPKSPSIERRVLDIKEKEQEFEHENYYKTCSGKMTDRRILMFLSQVGFGSMISIFCMYKLSGSSKCEDTGTYIGLLSAILGIFLPQPSIKK